MTTTLTDCGCCAGVTVETPMEVFNRPGLSAIAYRIGTHAQFKASMLARLSANDLGPQLNALRTREDDDFSIALLDAWATVADVLTFYQERIANESYLRTATERLSLLQLARLIGYELKPGVAANAFLAFTVDTAAGAPKRAIVDIGVKVQSIPGPGEKPQTYETIEQFEARAEWNALRPQQTVPQTLAVGMTEVLLASANTNLKKGDWILLVTTDATPKTDFRRIASVDVDNVKQQTKVTLETKTSPIYLVYEIPTYYYYTTPSFGYAYSLSGSAVESSFGSGVYAQSSVNAYILETGWSVSDVYTYYQNQTPPAPPPDTGFFAFRVKDSLFGYNAPDWNALSDQVRGHYYTGATVPSDWPGAADTTDTIQLASVHNGILENSWLVVQPAYSSETVTRVSAVTESAAAEFAISGKVTELTLLDDVTISDMSDLRGQTVFAQSENIPLADLPYPGDPTLTYPAAVQGDTIPLDTLVEGLQKGQRLIFSGERADLPGVRDSEVAELKDVVLDLSGTPKRTVLKLAKSLKNPYKRDTVMIAANVVHATQGETKTETLGSGDASQPFQKFTLKQAPLTYITAANPNGADSTLEVRVNDILWHEVPTLYGRGKKERVYITHRADDGTTTVEFGDGKTGARLPTGQENVKAKYRQGIGTGGLVKADQLQLLMTRPLGVKGVTNPTAPDGAEDPQNLADARQNAPLGTLTLGRIVSLRDYEDFARSFSGIAKALATWTWFGQSRGVFVTVAGPNGATIDEESDTYKDLLKAMLAEGDPFVGLRVQTYRKAFFTIDAGIRKDPDYLDDKVLGGVETALRTAFAFEPRAFGQSVTLSEIVAVMQAVPGVREIDVNLLYRDSTPTLSFVIEAGYPQPGAGTDGTIAAAELLTLTPDTLALKVIK